MTFEVLLQGAIRGLLMGFVYALIAAGLSLIFGLMEIVNFAHGEFLMLAMFSTFWAWSLWRLDPLVSLPLTAALLFLLGIATYHGVIRWVLGAPMLAQIFATFGLAIFLRAGAQALWGVDFHLVKDPLVQGRVSLGGLFIGLPQLVASVGALCAFGFLNWFISRTETGLALQATSQDRQAASLMGIDTQRMFALGWGIGAACVGVAGALLTIFFSEQISAVITAINRDRGITVIFIEQNVELALTLAHRGYVLESGRNVLEGPSATLLQSSEVRRIFLGT